MFLAPSFEDALLNMNFISVLNVDCFDAVLILSKKENSQPSCNIKEMPNTSLSLDMGIVSIYTCSDSFACLLDSFGEWFIKVTAPSAADVEIIRQQYMMSQEENAKDEKISNEGQFFSESLSSVIDDDLFSDVVSINDSTIKESTSVTFEQQPNTLAHPNDEVESRIFDSSLIINDFYVPNSPGIESNDHHSQSISFEDESWTTVDHQWSKDPCIPDGEEQSARWYTIEDEHGSLFDSDEKYRPRLGLPPSSINIVVGHTNRELRVFPRHIPLILKSDDHRNSDSTVVSKLYGLKVSPLVRLKVIIENLSLKWRCFGGNDWEFPNNQSNQVSFSVRNDDADVEKVALMDELLGPPDNGASNIFDIDDDIEQNISSQCKPQQKRQPRQQRRFFQFSFNGLKIRKDFFSDEALVSYMDVSVMDFAIWENISGTKPLKMIGEWLDEVEHPRDSNDGLLMMKMLSMNPLNMFSSDGNLMSEEARATMDILPLRCFIHQSALQFMREFFTSQEQRNSSMDKDSNSDKITEKKSTQPENFFQKFKVRPVKLKVDYRSKGVDTNALKDGSYVELINLLPIEQMVLTMNAVEMRNLTGWGSIISELVCNWLEHIVTTQMYKFITQTSPVHPISQIVGEMKNMVVIPLAEYKDSGNVSRSIRKGGLRLLKTCATETLNIGSKSLRFASKSLRFPNQIDSSHSACNQHYQERPIVRSINQASVPAFRSLSTGLKDANTKIVMIPYREYRKTGTMGAVQSVMKTLPVAIFQPLAGATEALSYGLEGAMNQLRPDLRREKEASEWLEDDF
jgi:autophagy-related protein 2